MAWQSSFCPRMEIGMSDKSASIDRHAPGPRLNISCCASDRDSTCAAPSHTDSAHAQHTATATATADHDHDHDHSSLPGPRRIAAALLAATGAELLHLLGPDTPLWQGAGMVLAAAAILLAGLGI